MESSIVVAVVVVSCFDVLEWEVWDIFIVREWGGEIPLRSEVTNSHLLFARSRVFGEEFVDVS